MNLSKYKRWRGLLNTVIVKQQAKRKAVILCIYMQWKSMKRWRTLMHIMIMKNSKK